MGHLTRLQYAFSKSAIRRRFALELMQSEGLPVKGYKRLMNSVYSEVLEAKNEPQIKYILLSVLQCYDITPEERAEALKLLQMGETTLSEAQRQQLRAVLFE